MAAGATLADLIASKTMQAIEGAIKNAQPELFDVSAHGAKALADDLLGDTGNAIDPLHTMLSKIPVIGGLLSGIEGDVTGVLNPLKDIQAAIGRFPTGIGLGYLFGYAAYQLIQPGWRNAVQHAERAFHSLPLDPATAADAHARRIHLENDYEYEASLSGLDGNRFEVMRQAAQAWPGAPELLDMRRRNIITGDELTRGLELAAVPQEFIQAWRDLERVLLSPADMALAVLRGYVTETVATEYVAQLGVDGNDFRTLIANTGEPPGLMELLEAFRRKFIDQARLVRGIKQSRVRDEWIDVIERLRYSPMSTADAVRARVENYITDAEVADVAQKNGLEPGAINTLVRSWGRPLAHMEMGSLVHRGLASRAQFDQAMRESDLKDKYIPLSFDITTPLLPERLIVTAIHHNAIDLKTGAKMLLWHGYTPEAVGILLKLGLREQATTAHELTRAQITTLYAEGGLNRADALKHLEALGFSAEVATYELDIVDLRQHAAELRQEISVIRTNYLAGSIDAVQAETEMTQLGLSTAQATHNIQVWNRERRRATRSLTEGQIVKGAKNQVFTPDGAITLLVAIGYSRADAVNLLRENGVPVVA